MRRRSPLIALSLLAPVASATHLTDSLLNQVYNVMNDISTASWENGTRAQAILEATYPDISVFSANSPFPLPEGLQSGQIPQIVDIAEITMNNRPASTVSITSFNGSTLLEDGAAADPASLGVAILLAEAATGNAQVKGVSYGDAATAEVNYLMNTVPRAPNGAISHRAEQPQLWSDFVYMVPPFLAYYGVLRNNQTLVEEAYNQIGHYRQVLGQDNGLWSHILLGHGQASDLESWIGTIFNAAQGYITDDGLFHNYINDTSSFTETSGAALFAASGFRLSTLNITDAYTATAVKLLSAVSSHVNSTGFLGQVVNPFDFTKQGSESSEGQSFVVMAYAAYKEWDSLGRKGVDAKGDPLGDSSTAFASVSLPGAAVVLSSALLGVLGWSVI